MDYVSRLVAVPTTSQKVTAFCLLYSAMAFILFPRTFLDVLGAYPIVRFYFFLPLLLAVGLCGAALLHSHKHPIQFMRWKLHDRGKGALITLLVLVISASAFTTLRHEYSFIVPFHADEVLADMDAALHFGDPWRHLRAIFPQSLSTLLFALYTQLWFIEVAAVLVYAAFVSNRDERERYFVSFALTVILLSSVVRIAGSSGGPIFYDRLLGGDRFADLTAALNSDFAGRTTLALTDYLYASYTSQRTVIGTGISAMPSMHVALAFLNAMFLASRSVMVGRIAWAYAGIILFGSVYFGWHYAMDGYISILCVMLIWMLAENDDRTDNEETGGQAT